MLTIVQWPHLSSIIAAEIHKTYINSISSDTNFGTGYYLASVVVEVVGGGGSSILGGITSFWGEKRGGSVVTENPKGGTTQICLKNEDVGGGRGSRKSSKVTRGDHFGEATFKGGIG